jgi:excisionase family DNA binding protein
MIDKDVYMTRKEVAELFRVTPETVSDWVKARKLKATKIGKKLLIHKDTVKDVTR